MVLLLWSRAVRFISYAGSKNNALLFSLVKGRAFIFFTSNVKKEGFYVIHKGKE
ncbi:hypothetical protein D3C74_318170 [compost metagenome]